MNTPISDVQRDELFQLLQKRFEKNKRRHEHITWEQVIGRLLQASAEAISSLHTMEESLGEPDVIGYDDKSGMVTFCDCAPESPKGRRSLCYDQEALDSRKQYKPDDSVVEAARKMGIELLDEDAYHHLQTLGKFDSKTSSWLKTPAAVRDLGGALFGDYRFGRVFIYHNGAESYYVARGFRGLLKI